MIKIYHKSIRDEYPKVLNEFKVGSWIYVEDPTEQELDYLANKFNLEEGLLKDAIDPNEVPRMEIEDNVKYIFTRVPYSEDQQTLTAPLLIAVGKDFLITVSQKTLPFITKFSSGALDFNTNQKTKLFLQIFFQIISTYNISLTDISRRIRQMSIRLEKIGNKDIVQFVTFEGVLNDFMAALVPTNTILKNLLSGKFLKLYEDDKDLTEDLFLSSGQIIESCRANLKNIVNIRESFSLNTIFSITPEPLTGKLVFGFSSTVDFSKCKFTNSSPQAHNFFHIVLFFIRGILGKSILRNSLYKFRYPVECKISYM